VTGSLDLGGQCALVTGAGSGIGRACADTLAAHGAHVLVADLVVERAAETVDAIVGTGGTAEAVRLDVSDWLACRAVAESASQPIDIVVNAAATWTMGPFLDMDPETWRRDFDVTLFGTLNVTRALLPAMVARRSGTVINISSDAGRSGEPGQVVYAAAKAGVIGMTKSLAAEIGRDGVRVNCIAPGLTRTPGSASFIESVGAEKLGRRYPLGRIGEPTDIADAVLFLASDLSSWITGQVVSVNGGYLTAG
jgi:2-hydroxycyclohexanecarboxyl-CoA dehydrogenase